MVDWGWRLDMTVEQLLQKLVELARDGKGQYAMKLPETCIICCEIPLENLIIMDDKEEVVVD
jgi:hypothetical protein